MLAGAGEFAPAGATKGLSDRPLETFGHIRYDFLQVGEAKVFLHLYRKHTFFSGLRRTLPSWHARLRTLTMFFASSFPQIAFCMLAGAGEFAPAGATKGLSDRPLETFGHMRYDFLAGWGSGSFLHLYRKHTFFSGLGRTLPSWHARPFKAGCPPRFFRPVPSCEPGRRPRFHTVERSVSTVFLPALRSGRMPRHTVITAPTISAM